MSTAIANAVRDAERLLGPGNVLTEPADLVRYQTGARYGDGRAAFVVRPSDTEQVAAVMRVFAREGVRCVPQGANTGLVGASTPDASGAQAVLSLDRMTHTFELDVANRSLAVSAGHTLSSVNSGLEPHGLFFPIDLGADPSIGGMIATNTGGARFIRYGDVRRNVLGLEAVLPDGATLDLMTSLRKNNVGVDLKQLFIGSGGAFGVVTRAVLALHPTMKQSAVALVVPARVDAVGDLLRSIEDNFMEFLVSFEGMSRNAMQSVFRHGRNVRNPFAPGPVPELAFLIELGSHGGNDGMETLQDRLEEFLAGELEAGRIGDAYAQHPQALWAVRHSISEALRHEGRLIALDIAVNRGRLAEFRRVAMDMLARRWPFLAVHDFGHWADGGLHFNVVWPHEAAEPYDAATAGGVKTAVYELVVREFEGTFSAEHGIGPHNIEAYRSLLAPDALALHATLQNAFDPQRLCGNISLGPAMRDAG